MIYLVMFFSGILTFVSPCFLPLLPLYISYMAGNQGDKKTTIKNSLAFCLGFTIAFLIIGVVFSNLYIAFAKEMEYVRIIMGIIIIIFGLDFLGFNIIKFKRSNFFNVDVDVSNLNVYKSFVFGLVFSISHSHCLNVFLGTALVLTASSDSLSAINGFLQILVYSLGLSLPFLLFALLIDKLNSTFDFLKKNMESIRKLSGYFIILMGILIILNIQDKIILYFS